MYHSLISHATYNKYWFKSFLSSQDVEDKLDNDYIDDKKDGNHSGGSEDERYGDADGSSEEDGDADGSSEEEGDEYGSSECNEDR